MPIFRGQPQTLIYDPTTGIITDANGNVVSGVAAYAWADFTAGGFDLTVARHITVTDKHSSISGYGGSLWYIDPSAPVGYKRQLRSECIVTTWANRPAAASYPGIVIKVSDLRYSEYYSDGANYLPVGPQLIYRNTGLGTIASPTCTVNAASTKYTITGGAPTIPANLLTSTSRLRLQVSVYKTGAVGACQTLLYFGTSGDNTDLGMSVGSTQAGTASDYRHGPIFEFTGATSLWTTYNAPENTNAISSFTDRASHINVASDMIFSLYSTATYGAGDVCALVQFAIWHEA